LKILVVDDHPLVREGLRQVLRGLDEHAQVFDASTCAAAFAIAQAQPDLDLVLLDYHLPDMNGMAALDVFGRRYPTMPVVILSGSVNPRIRDQVVARGAAAFLTKSSMSDELISVARQVLRGDAPVIERAASPSSDEAMLTAPLLTPRQEEVLRLLLDGYANKEIGRMLGLSGETVKNHVSNILRSFGVTTRTQAVLAARQRGYVGGDMPPSISFTE
jgi:DNA-binding NarL/FixJ family response regulator